MAKPKAKLPKGWDEAKVRRVADFYDKQSEQDAVVEDEAAFAKSTTVIEIPSVLLPKVLALVAQLRKGGHNEKARRRKSA